MSIRGRGIVAIVASASLWTSAAPAAQSPQQPPPVFRAGTDLVEVDVIVRDKTGAFVEDLSTSDFMVEEDGHPQGILQFYLHATTGPVRVEATAGQSIAAGPGAGAPRVFLVVFDDEHMTPSGFKRTQAAAQALFSLQFRRGDVGGVVTRGRVVNSRLTSDREELLKAVKDVKPTGNKQSRLMVEQEWPRLSEVEAVRISVFADKAVLEESIRRACSDRPEDCGRIDPELFVRSKASELTDLVRSESTKTLQTLLTLANGLSKMPGRKTIVLMSEGFLADESWPLVKDAVEASARANARIYTLDARGLEREMRTVFDAAPTGNDTNSRLLEQMDFGSDSINSLAVDTGGFVVRNTNDFNRAIERISDDAGNYYVLAFRPESQRDGQFHRIAVKVKRPGLAVRARRGYVALPMPSAHETVTAAGDRAPQIEAPAETSTAAAPADASTVARPVVDPASIEARVVPRGETASGIRVRPDAESHADALASGGHAADPEATAGWDAYQRGDVETARERLSVAAARRTADPWVFYTLGMSNYALKHFRDALTAWERVRAAVPDFEPVYFDLVDAYLQEKEHDQAIKVARAGIQRWPGDPELLNALGVVQTVRGALDDAVKSFQSAIAVAPQEATAYFNLGKALEMRYARSRRYVQQLRQWVSNESDRASAVENYKRYLDLGGAYADAARAGLTRLAWVPNK